MTTIIVNVDREDTTLYADRAICFGSRHVAKSVKIHQEGSLTFAFCGSYSYLPDFEELYTVSAQGFFTSSADWYKEHISAFREDRSAENSPLCCVVIDNKGNTYYNNIGASYGIKLSEGIHAFGSGSEYAQGYLNAVKYFSDVEYHHIEELYKSISNLGYGTSAEFDCIKVDRNS